MIRKIIALIFIITSGETIFMLPFLIPRLLRPLMLDAWSLSNTDIGLAFSAYGISSMFSYLLGGSFADRYPPKKLISISLISTALGGLVLSMYPSRTMLICIYFYFGISTTFLMWSALIKFTHDFGGEEKRSSAMGLLDSGRGFVAAIMSSFLSYIIADQLTSSSSLIEKSSTLNSIILLTAIFCIFISIGVWFTADNLAKKESKTEKWDLQKAKLILKNSNIWTLGIIILCSYCGYKSVDNYSVYLVDIQKVSLIESSRFTSIIFWLRPISALLAGLFADRIAQKFKGGRFIAISSFMLIASITQLLLGLEFVNSFNIIFLTILTSASFAYALRSVYFSIFGDIKIPSHLVGTTIGIVSLVGFLPDMFFGSLTGYLIDRYPGVLGYSYVFKLTAVFLFIGSLASLAIYKKSKNTVS